MSNYKKGPYGTDDMADVLDGLGTASTRSVQTSPTDATAGRVLTTGAFGLGVDTNAAYPSFAAVPKVTGTYQVISTAPDRPAGTNTFWVAHVTSLSSARATMLVQGAGDTANVHTKNNSIYRKWMNNGEWNSPWQELYHTGNLNTLEFGGVSAGRGDLPVGFAVSATEAQFFSPINLYSVPSSITVISTFSLRNIVASTLKTGITSANILFSTSSSARFCIIRVTGLSSLSVGQPVQLRGETSSSKITVNP
jgi:hypothetical protein